MIIEILNEAVKKTTTKKAPTPKKKQVVEKKVADKKITNIPDKLITSFGDEITNNIKKYIEGRIEKGLYNDTIIGRIPENAIFFVFDTETTGLNMSHDDVITEIACLAYDKEFTKIDEYHATVELPEEKNPEIFINQTYRNLNKIGLSKEQFNEILAEVERYLGTEKVRDFGENELTHTMMIMIFNGIKGINKKLEFHNENYPQEDKELLNQIYKIINPLMKGENIKTILKMTKYGQVEAGVHEPDENSMVHNFLNFIHKVVATKSGIPILVAHNYPYDHKMLRQAFTRANKVYEDIKFIDTAQLTRYYAYRYSYLLYLYNKKKIERTNDGKHLQEIFKFHPLGNARMGTLAQHYKIPNLNWHTAKNDVEATAQILKYLFAIDAYYKDYMNKKNATDEHFDEIKGELDIDDDKQRFRIDQETGERKEVDWFSPLSNKYMSAHQADFSNFVDKMKDTGIYMEHFKDVSKKYVTKIEDFMNKNGDKYGANSQVRKNFNLIEYELNNTYQKVFNSKSKKQKTTFIDETASLIMKVLKQTGIGPKDYIYYGKEIGVNYKKYILLNYIGEFAHLFSEESEESEEAMTVLLGARDSLVTTNKDMQINGIKKRIDNIFVKNPDKKNSKEYQNYILDIGASEKHYEELVDSIVSHDKKLYPEFTSAVYDVLDEEEIDAFEKFIKQMNKKKAGTSTRFEGPLWQKYTTYYIDNDYIRSLVNY